MNYSTGINWTSYNDSAASLIKELDSWHRLKRPGNLVGTACQLDVTSEEEKKSKFAKKLPL